MSDTVHSQDIIKNDLLKELTKCSFCGLCEWVCPTLSILRHRAYGPRGRVEIIIQSLSGERISDIAKDSLYTCLLCRACTTQCPAGIDIPKHVRKFKSFSIATL